MQIERVFTHHGFAVFEKDVTIERPMHGSEGFEAVERRKFVQNPMSLELVPLTVAFNKLMGRYVQSVLFGFSKMEIIESLIID